MKPLLLAHDLDRPVVVAVIAVRMVEVPVHKIIDVVAVRDRFVAAAGAVDVFGQVRATRVAFGALVRIRAGHGNHVIVTVIPVGMEQMPIAQVVGVAVMLDGGVTAIGAVLVIEVAMSIARNHAGFTVPHAA